MTHRQSAYPAKACRGSPGKVKFEEALNYALKVPDPERGNTFPPKTGERFRRLNPPKGNLLPAHEDNFSVFS